MTASEAYGSADIRAEWSGPVLVLRLNRPQKRNALTSRMLATLHDDVARAQGDHRVGAVLLAGSGPAFCAGLDLDEVRGSGANRRPEDTGRGPLPVDLHKPLVAAVHGACSTGALEIVLRAHSVVAGTGAWFADRHIEHGLVPRWGMTGLLTQAVGIRTARELSLTARRMTAQEAWQRGLVQHLVADDEVIDRAREVAAAMAGHDGAHVRRVIASYEALAAAHRAPADLFDVTELVRRMPRLP